MLIIGRTLLLYAYLFNFTAHLGKKRHFTSALKITIILIWSQITKLKKFQKTRRGSFCFAYASEACHILIDRKLKKKTS